MTLAFHIRPAVTGDRDALLPLFPRLAGFDVPARRNPRDLWRGDQKMFLRWLAGEAPDCHVRAAVDDDGVVLGFAMFTLREEILNHEPSAHLETLVVAEHAQRRGVGSALLQDAEAHALALGARSMSLHVFGRNERARAVYARAGYDSELIRCIKWLDDEHQRP